jgi:hypothetical protein
MNNVILNSQRPLWEGDREVAKRSSRDEPMWVAIHKCMEAMLGISLCSYLYSKLAKTICLSYYLLNKIREEDRTDSAWKGYGGVAQTMYTHISKCKNDKIKGERKKEKGCLRFTM